MIILRYISLQQTTWNTIIFGKSVCKRGVETLEMEMRQSLTTPPTLQYHHHHQHWSHQTTQTIKWTNPRAVSQIPESHSSSQNVNGSNIPNTSITRNYGIDIQNVWRMCITAIYPISIPLKLVIWSRSERIKISNSGPESLFVVQTPIPFPFILNPLIQFVSNYFVIHYPLSPSTRSCVKWINRVPLILKCTSKQKNRFTLLFPKRHLNGDPITHRIPHPIIPIKHHHHHHHHLLTD